MCKRKLQLLHQFCTIVPKRNATYHITTPHSIHHFEFEFIQREEEEEVEEKNGIIIIKQSLNFYTLYSTSTTGFLWNVDVASLYTVTLLQSHTKLLRTHKTPLSLTHPFESKSDRCEMCDYNKVL